MQGIVTTRVNARLEANTSSDKLNPLEIGSKVSIVGLSFSEEYRGSNLWYVDDNGVNYTSLAISLNLQNNRLSSLIDFPSIWNLTKGTVIKIGIYDSGVSNDTSLFGNRVMQVNDHSVIVERHADYMATIIAGNDVEKGYVGFLPTAQLYSYKSPVRAGKAIITVEDLKSALKIFLDKGVDLVNISMRSSEENDKFTADSELINILDEYDSKNIIVSACTGNDDSFKSDFAFFYPARLDKVFAVGGCHVLDQSSTTLDYGSNLWTGVKILAPADSIFDPDFFKRINLNDTVGTSVSCAITTGIFGILKVKHLGLKGNAPLFKEYLNEQILSMPDLSIASEIFKPKFQADSFKYLDFVTLKKNLSI